MQKGAAKRRKKFLEAGFNPGGIENRGERASPPVIVDFLKNRLTD